MYLSRIASIVALLVLTNFLAAAESDALNNAINRAINDPNMPFQLDVYCTDAKSRRSLVVFRGKVGVWNGERQVRLRTDDRAALLQLLLDSGFASFEARYGEQDKADKQEAPLRATCRVRITVAGVEKESMQLLDGDQSPALLGLAAALLNQIEPRAANGIVATSLENGLVDLGSGAIAPELLELRLLRLPANRNAVTGFILRIRGAEISCQPYSPGQLVGDTSRCPLDESVLKELVSALRNARVWDLPPNLRYEGTAELAVAVLGSRYSVNARSTFRTADVDSQMRFERMIKRIESLLAGCSESH